MTEVLVDRMKLRSARDAAARAINGPVIRAMRAWIGGSDVLTLPQQIAMFGPGYSGPTWRGGQDVDDAKMISISAERRHFVDEFGFSVPTSEAIATLVAGGPLLEIGAGSGYWSRLVAQAGGDVIASDPRYERGYGFEHARYLADAPIRVRWFDLEAKSAVRRYPDRNVFCSWPSLDKTWLRQAMRAMRPGRVLFVVREDACAEVSTWEELQLNFGCIGSRALLGWHFYHDHFEAWRKKGGPHRRPSSAAVEDD